MVKIAAVMARAPRTIPRLFACRARFPDGTRFASCARAMQYLHKNIARRDRPPAVVLGDLTMIRSLGMAGIRSIVVTTDPRDVALRSRYAISSSVVPGWGSACAPKTLERLLDLGRSLSGSSSHKPPLFYGTDAQVAFLHAHRAKLAEHFALLLNDDDVGLAALDKERFDALAHHCGIPTPRVVALAEAHGPVLVKPKRKVAWEPLRRAVFGGSGKARVFTSRQELERAHIASHAPDLVVQEYIPAQTSDLCSFHGFADSRSELLASFCGRKIRTYPPTTGDSSFIELTDDQWDVAKLGAEVVERLGLVGPFKIDMIRDRRNGALYVLEVNPRFTLWSYLGAVHGVNLPYVAYEHLAGRPVPPVRLRTPTVRWLNFYRDYKSFRDQNRRGELGLGRWALSIMASPKVYETFAWSDPAPFAWWIAGFAQGRA
jgi:predicted ATP-grasp superfamily ATP-dependent carboligase